MCFQKYGNGVLSVALILWILCSLSSCNLSSDPSEDQCIRAGRYTYQLHMSLEEDPATFPDGAELHTYSGVTWIEWRDHHFYFSGGENDAWAIKGTCDGTERAFVEITLHNQCQNGRISTATSTMAMSPNEQTPNVIGSYRIEWTCGFEPSYQTLERWDVFPAYEPAGSTLPPQRCGGVRVGGYCWYFGAQGQSCDEVCASHGGYHDATRFYAGSAGSNSQCIAVLDALGAPTGADGLRNDDISAAGCCYLDFPDGEFQPPDMRVRYLMATNASAKSGNILRACACQQ
jgi:hypothetical protein